jgi:hypothetical protein
MSGRKDGEVLCRTNGMKRGRRKRRGRRVGGEGRKTAEK